MDENVNTLRLVLPDFLLKKHLLHTHRYFDDAVFRLDIELCNETRFKAVGSLSIPIFILLMSIINYSYVGFMTLLENQSTNNKPLSKRYTKHLIIS